jgi:tetratricopeptide (TPR) repeat protein
MNLLLKTICIMLFGLLFTIVLSKNESLYAQLGSEQQNQVNQYNQLIENYIAQSQQKVASYYATKKAVVYINAGDNQKAIDSYLEASQLNTSIGNDLANIKIYNNIAMIYSDLNQLNKTLEYFDRSLRISKRYNRKEDIAISLMDLASVLLIKKKYDPALENLIEALKILDKINDPKLLRTCYNLMAECYKGKGDSKKQKESYDYFMVYDDFIKENKNLAENNTKIITDKTLSNTEIAENEIQPEVPDEKTINIEDKLDKELANVEQVISSINTKNNSSDSILNKTNNPEVTDNQNNKTLGFYWIIAGIGLFIVLLVGFILMFWRKRKNQIN